MLSRITFGFYVENSDKLCYSVRIKEVLAKMIAFHRIGLQDRAAYEQILLSAPERGCEYSFANLYLWGRQEVAFLHGCVAFFSHFYGKSIYPYPIGPGDKRAVIEEILRDAGERGIPCRISGITDADREELEGWFPGRFHIRSARDSFDYVYAIDALADLRGRKLQKKRNHFNKFQSAHPDYQVQPLDCKTLGAAQHMVNDWYLNRNRTDPEGDYLLENIAMVRAFRNFDELGLTGIALMEGDRILAVTIGSRMGLDTFDIHFEKAREDVDGAYAAVNCAFARYLRLNYPDIQYLNREDDMGIEGLRKAKLSYYPDHMVEKHFAYLTEEIYED